MDSLLNYIKNKSNRKNLIAVAVMLLALPVGLILLRSQQIFNPRASIDPIVFTGPNVEVIDGRKVLTKPEVALQITSKLGGPAPTANPNPPQSPSPSPSAVQTVAPSPTPTASPVAAPTPTASPASSPTTSLPAQFMKFIGNISPVTFEFNGEIVSEANAQTPECDPTRNEADGYNETCDLSRVGSDWTCSSSKQCVRTGSQSTSNSDSGSGDDASCNGLQECIVSAGVMGTMWCEGRVWNNNRCEAGINAECWSDQSKTQRGCTPNPSAGGTTPPAGNYTTPQPGADGGSCTLKDTLSNSCAQCIMDNDRTLLQGIVSQNEKMFLGCPVAATVGYWCNSINPADCRNKIAPKCSSQCSGTNIQLDENKIVRTCKKQNIPIKQLRDELRKAEFNGDYNNESAMIEAYRQAACPLGDLDAAIVTCKTRLGIGGPKTVQELMDSLRAPGTDYPNKGFKNMTLNDAIRDYDNAQPDCRRSPSPTPRATIAATSAPTPVGGLCSSPRDFSKVARGLVVQNPMSSDQILAKVCADSGQDVASCRIQVVSHYKGFDSEDPNNQLYNTEVISANGKFWVLGKVGSATGTSGFAGTSKRLVATGNNEDLEDFNQICKFRPNQSGRCILDNISHFKGFDTDDKKSLLYNTEFISGYGKFAVLSDINIESRLRAEGLNPTQVLANSRKLNNGRYVIIEGNLSDAFPTQCQGRTTDCKLDVVQHYRDFDTADAQSNLYNTEFISAYGKYWVLGKANQQGQRTVVSTGDLRDIAEFAAMCSCGTGACVLDEVSHFKGFDNDSDNVEYAGGVGWYWVLKSLQTPSTPNPTPTPTSSPTPRPVVYTTSVKVAETREALAGATAIPYTQEPLLINYEFQNTDPGQKFIFVEYTASDGTKSIESAQIDLIDKAPVITSVSCVTDLQNSNNVKFTIKGERFGTSGSIKVGNRNLNLDGSWSSTEVKANLSDSGLVVSSATPTPTPTATPRATGTASPTPTPTVTPSPTPASSAAIGIIRRDGTAEYNLTLTRSDGRTVSEKCTVGQTQLSLGAQLFCREPNSFALNDVDMVLVRLDENGSKTSDRITQKVTVDPNGYIRLNRNLQDGQMYEVSLKAPRSVRRVAKFTAAGNTNSITNFILPVGDVAPLPNGDGAINTLDRAELNNEWKVSSPSATLQPADFNKDFRVNSVDWACMRYDFGSTNQSEP